ncbi:MAG: DUF4465 domain-containing protein [Spirochaetes bacterium]|jgi:hypothetical protein|nr:DUF4465 domain-containing protein [Spirochaetota bacterium]
MKVLQKYCSTLLLLAFFISFTACEDYTKGSTVITFEELDVPVAGYWNGSDLSGSFSVDNVSFLNTYNSDYMSWNGIAYSTMTDTETTGYDNQYSVFHTSGNNNSEVFAIAYPNGEEKLIELNEPAGIKGFYVTNTTYVYHSLKTGEDGFGAVTVFGGDDGNAEDYLLLKIRGYDSMGVCTGNVEFYLADYRFEDNSQDYIIDEWTWVDLSKLGDSVKEISFEITSTDLGDWGMNTPAYFAFDDLAVYL